jgi:hypothetical protein
MQFVYDIIVYFWLTKPSDLRSSFLLQNIHMVYNYINEVNKEKYVLWDPKSPSPVEEQTSDNRRILYLLRNIYLNIIFYLFNHYLFCHKAVKVYMAINIDLKKQKTLLNTLTSYSIY